MNSIHPGSVATLFHAAFETFPLGAALVEASSGRILEVNAACAVILGASREAVAGWSLAELIEPGTASVHELPWTRADQPQAAHFETRLQWSGKAPVKVRMTLTPFVLGSTPAEQWLCQIETLAAVDAAATRKGTEDPCCTDCWIISRCRWPSAAWTPRPG